MSLCFVSTKIEKEKRENAKHHGMIRTEITGAEIAEEMEKERRLFQLHMCEVTVLLYRPLRVITAAITREECHWFGFTAFSFNLS